MQLKGALEDNILTVLCWDEKHAAELVFKLEPRIFSTRIYRKIAEAAFDYLHKFGKPPKLHIRDVLEADLRKGEEGKLLRQTIDAMEELARELQPEYVLASLEHFIEKRQLTMAVEAAADALQGDDIERAREALLARALREPQSPGIWVNDPGTMFRFLNVDEGDYFTSGVTVFDERGIRPARGQMWLFVAPPKRGKSWHMIEVARLNAFRGRKVLHISLENSEDVTAMRYAMAMFAMASERAQTVRMPIFMKNDIGACTGIEFDSRTVEAIMHTSRSKLTEKLKAAASRGRILIKGFPTGSLTFAQYEAYLDYLEKSENFVPDMVVLDYPDLMAVDPAQIRTSLGMLFKSVRGSAVKRNYALVVCTQGNRNSASARTVTERDVAEDYSKIATADTVIIYSQTGEERKLGTARLLVSNARMAEDKFIVLVSQNYATGQFCVDSVYMNKHIESEMDRLTGKENDNDD